MLYFSKTCAFLDCFFSLYKATWSLWYFYVVCLTSETNKLQRQNIISTSDNYFSFVMRIPMMVSNELKWYQVSSSRRRILQLPSKENLILDLTSWLFRGIFLLSIDIRRQICNFFFILFIKWRSSGRVDLFNSTPRLRNFHYFSNILNGNISLQMTIEKVKQS